MQTDVAVASIFYHPLIPFSVTGVLEFIPACTGREAVCNLDRSCHKASTPIFQLIKVVITWAKYQAKLYQ